MIPFQFALRRKLMAAKQVRITYTETSSYRGTTYAYVKSGENYIKKSMDVPSGTVLTLYGQNGVIINGQTVADDEVYTYTLTSNCTIRLDSEKHTGPISGTDTIITTYWDTVTLTTIS